MNGVAAEQYMEKAVFLHQQYYKVQPQLYAVSAFASLVALVVVVIVIVLAAKKLVKDVQKKLTPWPSLMLCHQCNLKRF